MSPSHLDMYVDRISSASTRRLRHKRRRIGTGLHPRAESLEDRALLATVNGRLRNLSCFR
jgi:hypothetical protein